MSNNKKEKAVKGLIIEALPAANFKVRISTDEEILAYPSGKMRINFIKILPGDEVLMELSEDRKRGRIIKRL